MPDSNLATTELSPERAEALLRKRAERYATREEHTLRETREVVTFRRGSGEYAIELAALLEIRPLERLCPIPSAPAVVPGGFHCRGELISAHDLEAHLVQPSGPPTAPWVLVVEHGARRLGLMADAVHGVDGLADDERLPLPVTLGERSACFAAAIGDGRLLVEPAALFLTPSFFHAF